MNDEEFRRMKQETDYMFEMMQKMNMENERAQAAQLAGFEKLVNLQRKRNRLEPVELVDKEEVEPTE